MALERYPALFALCSSNGRLDGGVGKAHLTVPFEPSTRFLTRKCGSCL